MAFDDDNDENMASDEDQDEDMDMEEDADQDGDGSNTCSLFIDQLMIGELAACRLNKWYQYTCASDPDDFQSWTVRQLVASSPRTS